MDGPDERGDGTPAVRPSAPPSISVRQWIAAVVLCMGQLMIILDGTAVNVALPAMQRSLHFSQADLAWVINAYLITFAGFLMLAGRMGDLVGRKRVFLSGLVLFTLASLACGVSGSQTMLIAARFVQGIGGAISSSVILAILIAGVPGTRERAKMIGVYTLVSSTGGSLGLVLGGVVTQAINWHWIFIINIPIGTGVLVLAMILVEENAGAGIRSGVDALGALLLTGALMLAVYAIVTSSDHGWGAAQTIASSVGAVVVFAAFIVLESRLRNPLIPLGILRSRNLSSSNLVRLLLVCSVTGQFFIGVLFLQRVLAYSALNTGLAYLPLTIVLGPFALMITSRLVTRIGPKATMVPGMLLVAGGLLLLARAPIHSRYVTDLLPAIVLLGVGQGLAFLPTVTLAMTGATPADAGLRSGLVNVSQQIGSALGVAVLASVASGRTNHLLALGHARVPALLSGYHLAYDVATAIVLAAAVAVLTLIRALPGVPPATREVDLPAARCERPA